MTGGVRTSTAVLWHLPLPSQHELRMGPAACDVQRPCITSCTTNCMLGVVTVQSWSLTKSMVDMLCSWMAAMCCLLSRMARIPPCTPGCSVFTRPAQTQHEAQAAKAAACHNAVWHSLCNEWSVERTDLLHPCIPGQSLTTPNMPQELSKQNLLQLSAAAMGSTCKQCRHPPSSISGKPVRSSTFLTGTPAASTALALPPVDTISYPISDRPCSS